MRNTEKGDNTIKLAVGGKNTEKVMKSIQPNAGL